MSTSFYKAVVSITCFFIGLLFVFSGSFWKLETTLVKIIEPVFTIKPVEMSILIAVTVLMLGTALIAFSPIGSVSIPFMLKIAYELCFGVYKEHPVYFHLFMNYVVSVLCLLVAIYSAYRQYKWIMKDEQKMKEKTLLKFI